MTDPLGDALKQFRESLLELEGVSIALRATPLLFDLRRLPPRPRGPQPQQDDDDDRSSGPAPILSPDQVLSGWRAGGPTWVYQLGRRHVAAVSTATRHPTVGPLLSAYPGFVDALIPRLRPRQRVAAISRMWFHHYPPSRALAQQLARLHETVRPDGRPRWWGWTLSGPEAQARRMAQALGVHDWGQIAAAEEFPDEASGEAWSEAVCRLASPRELEHAVRLLRYCDRGQELGSPARLSSGGQHVVRMLVALAGQWAQHRGQVAALLRRRVGDVFGATEASHWRGLEAERNTVRSWVAGEVLDVLFKHLVPASDSAHQTEPRRRFWRSYTQRVDRLWLLVERRLQRRLEASDVRALLERCGEMVEVRVLEGSTERAIVWMQLRTASGEVVTVIEGNANTAFRARPGAFAPAQRRAVNYGSDIVDGPFREHHPGVVVRNHAGAWESRLARDLTDLGVRP